MTTNGRAWPKNGSLHLATALLYERLPLLRPPAFARPRFAADMRAGARADAGPNERLYYVRSVVIAWFAFALVFGLLMVALAWIGLGLGGREGRQVGLAAGAAVAFFCCAGMSYAVWRVTFAYAAWYRARRHGVYDSRSVWFARRSTLRNSSVILQILVATLAAYLILK